MNVHRYAIGAVALASLLTAGCKSEDHSKPESTTVAASAPPPPAPAPAPTPSATATAAPADTTAAADTTPPPDPPADQNETALAAKPPSPHHVWVAGYWHWLNRKYEWTPGYWEDQTAFATEAPPALLVEHPGLAPHGNFSWLPGYWHWGPAKKYEWAPGHWGAPRAGFVYTHPTYVSEKGHWVRQGLGWEKQDAAWTKAHPPTAWEKQGEVYVHKTEVAEFVKRGEREGWVKKK